MLVCCFMVFPFLIPEWLFFRFDAKTGDNPQVFYPDCLVV
jgi:hypothetical protein